MKEKKEKDFTQRARRAQSSQRRVYRKCENRVGQDRKLVSEGRTGFDDADD
jgi:hypothetical protein